MSGFVKSHRERFKHPLFRNEKFCRGYAWDWLVANAAFKDVPFDVSGRSITLCRGQLCYSIRQLADAWNWDKAAVSRFITRLKTETMIETSTDTGKMVITICNYDVYQGRNDAPDTVSDSATETEARQQRDSSETQKKNDKNDKNVKEDPQQTLSLHDAASDPSLFDAFWDVYPRKVGKQAAQKKFIEVVKAGADPSQLIEAARSFAQSKEGKDVQFIKHASTWLNGRHWEDEDEDEEYLKQREYYRRVIEDAKEYERNPIRYGLYR